MTIRYMQNVTRPKKLHRRIEQPRYKSSEHLKKQEKIATKPNNNGSFGEKVYHFVKSPAHNVKSLPQNFKGKFIWARDEDAL